MRWISFCGVFSVLLGVSIGGSEAQALVKLSFDSSTHPITTPVTVLPRNELVTFQVKIEGLQPGPKLDTLGITVSYTGALFSEKPEIIRGGIVSGEGWFDSDNGPPVVDASYEANGEDTCVQEDGVFFEFKAKTVDMATSGRISFQSALATEFNPDLGGDVLPVTVDHGAFLDYQIVPEPSAWILTATAALAAGAYLLKRRMLFSRS